MPTDGVFETELRAALGQYLSTFPGVHSEADYPYELSGIGISTELKDYIRLEYAPFDPDASDVQGAIVDRRLLIGDAWDTQPAQIDGLLELYETVVERLKAEMERVAGIYADCDTFWLHRPMHTPYQRANDWVLRITAANAQPRTTAAPNPAPFTMAQTPVTLAPGELFPSPSVSRNGWVSITHPAGQAWLPPGSGRRIRNDQANARNHGNYGGSVVAYSYGCKDLPNTYTQFLESNPHAPPEDGNGRQLRIANWSENQDGHKVGRSSTDAQGTIPQYTGCDCSGLTQNCITEATFPAPPFGWCPRA